MPELLQPPSRFIFTSDGFGIEPKVYAKAGGGKIYKGVAVFRSGTFRDSMGELTTWEDLHVKQMADNYSYLTSKGILGSVPARDGHSSYLVGNIPGRGEVVGWHRDLAIKMLTNPTDGKKYSYLLADYELTQQYAIEKHDNGTWRNRSAEIGGYRTNDESAFWPVYLGFAFVDFSAVEGLNFSQSQTYGAGVKFFSFFDGNNQGVSVDPVNNGANQGGTALPFPPNMMPGTQQHGQPAASGGTGQQQPFVFTVAGQQTTDYSAVQTRINQLEQFAKDTREAGRKSFVSGLVSTNRITAPQQAEYEAFALALDDDQYGKWASMWTGAPVPSILGNHSAAAVSNPGNSAQPADQSIQDAEEIVKMHTNGGVMSPDQIKQTSAYKMLVAAGKRPA